MQYTILCESIDITMFTYMSNCSETPEMWDKAVE